MHSNRRRGPAVSSTRQRSTRTALFALAVLVVACSSTETTPTPLTGVWGGRTAYVTPSDSFAFSFKQSGAEVEGWGIFYSGAGPGADTHFAGAGVIAGGELTMSLFNVSANSSILAGTYSLGGPVGRTPMNAVFEAGGKSYPISLRLSRPPSDLAGTWVLRSTTGTAAPAGLLDTIVANADGRAYRHREGDYAFGTEAIWSRHGGFMVIDQAGGGLLKDSLLIGSSELLRTAVTGSGARTDHYTRISTSAELP